MYLQWSVQIPHHIKCGTVHLCHDHCLPPVCKPWLDEPLPGMPVPPDIQDTPKPPESRDPNSSGGEVDGVREYYLKEDPKPVLGVMGVLLNGVNIFGVGSPCGFSSKCPQDGGPSKWVDAVESEGHTVDMCGGHAAPTHQYHIHSGVGLVTAEQRKTCELPVDTAQEHSRMLGWMFDGYGLYGRYSLNGMQARSVS